MESSQLEVKSDYYNHQPLNQLQGRRFITMLSNKNSEFGASKPKQLELRHHRPLWQVTCSAGAWVKPGGHWRVFLYEDANLALRTLATLRGVSSASQSWFWRHVWGAFFDVFCYLLEPRWWKVMTSWITSCINVGSRVACLELISWCLLVDCPGTCCRVCRWV